MKFFLCSPINPETSVYHNFSPLCFTSSLYMTCMSQLINGRIYKLYCHDLNIFSKTECLQKYVFIYMAFVHWTLDVLHAGDLEKTVWCTFLHHDPRFECVSDPAQVCSTAELRIKFSNSSIVTFALQSDCIGSTVCLFFCSSSTQTILGI